jgi:hypothetical protein
MKKILAENFDIIREIYYKSPMVNVIWTLNHDQYPVVNPETGHIHRRRSQTVQKAIDYINIILIQNKLAGNIYMEKAEEVIKGEIS